MTGKERNDLVRKASEQLYDLGMVLVPVMSHQPWHVNCSAVRTAYNTLAETVRALNTEVYVPGADALKTDTPL